MPEDTGRVLLSRVEVEKWKVHHKRLGGSPKLAGLFRGWIPDGYFTSGSPRILYVGKATSGPFGGRQAESKCFNGEGAFWRFARQIADAVLCADESIPCVAWSNISKISYPKIKAESSLIEGFEEEAAQTLRYEIGETMPHAIVFVTGRFSDQIVRTVSDGKEDSAWNKSENESIDEKEFDVWWRRRRDGIAVLWMRHPMGANRNLLIYAAAKIASLAGAEHRPEAANLSATPD